MREHNIICCAGEPAVQAPSVAMSPNECNAAGQPATATAATQPLSLATAVCADVHMVGSPAIAEPASTVPYRPPAACRQKSASAAHQVLALALTLALILTLNLDRSTLSPSPGLGLSFIPVRAAPELTTCYVIRKLLSICFGRNQGCYHSLHGHDMQHVSCLSRASTLSASGLSEVVPDLNERSVDLLHAPRRRRRSL